MVPTSPWPINLAYALVLLRYVHAATIKEELGEAEVDEEDLRALGLESDADILGLEVAVDEAEGVQVLQALQQLQADLQH
jgi:hypothetical protein